MLFPLLAAKTAKERWEREREKESGIDNKAQGRQRQETKGVSQGLCLLCAASSDKRKAISHPYSFLFANLA